MERNLTYEWDLEIFAYPPSARLSEEIDLLVAMWAMKIAHVFNYSNDWHIEFVEHANCLDCNIHRDILRSSHDQYASNWYRRCYCEWSVARTRGQVNYQIIKL